VADIFHSFTINAPLKNVFEGISTTKGLDTWWSKTSEGKPVIDDKNNVTEVHFYHKGWPQNNEHYRISCYCWAMYLRILKRYLEYGEQVPYENRLNA